MFRQQSCHRRRRPRRAALLALAAITALGGTARAGPDRSCVADLFCIEQQVARGRLELWLESFTARELTISAELLVFSPTSLRRAAKLRVAAPGRQVLLDAPLSGAAEPLYRWHFSFHPGAAPARHDPGASYRLPYPAGRSFTVIQGEEGALSHQGRDRFAIDWAMPVGTRVLAARTGTVLGLYQGGANGGPDRSFKGSENFVWIGHDDGTVGWYAHFKQAGVLVRPGQRVEAGTPIGLSGATGFASEPHLHFQVSSPSEDGAAYVTFPLRFRLAGGQIARLREHTSYLAP